MTDKPKITAKAEGDKVILQFRHEGIHFSGGDIALSPDQCFALQCQLSTARYHIEQGKAVIAISDGSLAISVRGAGIPLEGEVKPETWRDRGPML